MRPRAQAAFPKAHPAAWPLLWLSLMCCVFEGAVRKWGVGDMSIAAQLAYLSKDIVLVSFFVLGTGRASAFSRSSQHFLHIGIGLLAIGAIISATTGIDSIGAVLTVRALFVVPIAAWIASRHLPADALRRFALWLAILSLPLSFLGMLQFRAPSGSLLNRYSTKGEIVAMAGGGKRGEVERVRATGTFSYISGFGEFAPMAVWAALVTLTLAGTSRERWLGYAAFAAGMCCTFATVSRGAALVSLGLVGVWAFAGGKFGRKAQVALAIGIVGLAVLSLTDGWNDTEELVLKAYQRHQTADSVADRFEYSFVDPLHTLTTAPFGIGLGSQQAARADTTASTQVDGGNRGRSDIESPWGRTVFEVGIAGLLGFLLSLGVVFVPLWNAYWTNKRSEARTVLAVTGALLLVKSLMGFQFNHVSVYFFWATAACVLASGNGVEPRRQRMSPARVHPFQAARLAP